ncbi:phosphoenolpyruvate--protein phosphotransferase [Pseudomonas sp. CCI3.2]|uniref:phosphoenolpyruvate--protein phosphotransferase n=1 Tax=unclassified Pseudomonas TaxID=196821 RepID=UPI002AC92525|nr:MULTISPECIES: phosphoenolpyruvate--protein phosphotransferase [unclassified Pseudomonas]MEB0076991.1 phosphoenolpyruvate--protein phosphotransferase [Pseudomonas sp. MH10out]MEB0102385.1 phosphoenolpyruvate--protein phosphotransferase [Pseudomonas sp. CCI3.2]MEB0129082.1 phosphoenolpyruvate--protein phosphotransferase [Pseudomonas sp. CCI2.4]MEB0156391.1 phosphoenolpyruvate--protein phosphotransferase [Pseudomonas sp. AH2 (2023)]MEB0167061.1 phosphoenolpyruvate--protein phosphotransferase [
MHNNKDLILSAPLSGPVMPLSQVPDPVFASGALGEGIAIDPTNECLYAPCAGVVVHIARTLHAVTLRADNGAEFLLHVGLDTVALAGEGFTVLVEQGERVEEGQALLRLDLDRIAQHATSLISTLVLINGDRFRSIPVAGVSSITVGQPLLHVSAVQSQTALDSSHSSTIEPARGRVRVAHSGGLHARPAALVRQTAQGFVSQSELHFAGQSSSSNSLVGLMGLGIAEQDEVEVVCLGEDSEAALLALIKALSIPSAHEQPRRPSAPVVTLNATVEEGVLQGVCASPGLVSGPLFRLHAVHLPDEPGQQVASVQHHALHTALQQVSADIQCTLHSAEQRGEDEEAAIFSTHLALLEDPGLLDAAKLAIDQGCAATHAWSQALLAQCDVLQALGKPLLAERANDLRDLRQRVLRALLGDARRLDIPIGAIVVAHELTPSDLLMLSQHAVAGLCMAAGGATSHVAILARGKGLPCVVALGSALLDQQSGKTVVLNADQGQLELTPSAQRLHHVIEHHQSQVQQRRTQQQYAHVPAMTLDGVTIEVAANVASRGDAAEAHAAGADGVGLLRTEFLFVDRNTAPDEHEQWTAYQGVLDAMGDKPVVIRTIDVGGDKQLAYLPLPAEANPVLGLRGIRLGQLRPELLDQQLRALLRVSPQQRCRILLPMVSEVDELLNIRQRLEVLSAELGIKHRAQLGVMIEVPSAALLAEQLAEHADFLSIGTNDLSQYTLAMDRDHAGLAARVDALHPALLRLIAMTCVGAARHQRWVGVCGALASDPLATAALIGLGVRELSVSPPLIGEIKARVRELNMAECQRWSQSLLGLNSAQAVRQACQRHSMPHAFVQQQQQQQQQGEPPCTST